MKDNLQQQAEQFRKNHIRKKRWRRAVISLASMTVLITAYALMMPAITMTKEPVCGAAEHVHGPACRTEAEAVIGLENCSLDVHVHDSSCKDADGNLCCGYADYVIHHHDHFCRDAAGDLICPLPEVYEHRHTETCYEGSGQTCTCEGGTSGHRHTEACRQEIRTLVCTLPESDGHTHTSDCISSPSGSGEGEENAETVYTCGLEQAEAHRHSDSCFAAESVLTCGQAEAEGHVPSETCFPQPAPELVCTQREAVFHEHTAACFTNGVWTCGQLQVLRHQHHAGCCVTGTENTLICPLPEHTHTDACMSGGDRPSAPATLSGTDGHISVTVSGQLNPETTLQVREMSGAALPDAYLAGGEAQLVGTYDISLYLNEEETQPAGNVTVNIRGIENLQGCDITVYHMADDGSIKEIAASVAEDGSIIFETDGFSGFAIVKTARNGSGVTYPIGENPIAYDLQTGITVNEAAMTTGMTLQDGDAFRFTVSWRLPSGTSYTEADSFIYTLPNEIFALSDTDGALYGEDGTTVYGSYSIRSNVLTVQYNSEFLALSDRYSSVTADGTIQISQNITVTQEGYTITIPGLESVTVQLRTNTGMSVAKTSVKRIVENDSTHQAWVDYTVTLTANGLNENVRLTDRFYISLANPHKIGTTVPTARLYRAGTDTWEPFSITSNRDDTTGTGAFNSSDPHRITTAEIQQMNAGDILEITYSAKLVQEPDAPSHSYYRDASFYNTVTAESSQCAPVSDRTDDIFRMTYIDKDGGNVSGNLTKTFWRLYVCGGEYATLTVKDILPPSSNLICPDDTQVQVYAAAGRTSQDHGALLDTITFGELAAGYEVTFPESRWVMFYFECDAASADCTVRNGAQIVETDKTAEYAFSHGHTSATTGTKRWISAQHMPDAVMGQDYFKIRILNELNITVGTDSVGLEDFYFLDETSDGSGGALVHHFPATVEEALVSIQVQDPDTGGYSDAWDRFDVTMTAHTSSGQNNRLYFRFRGNTVIPGTYCVQYYTLAEHEKYNNNNNDVLITNKLFWSDGTSVPKGGGQDQTWRAYSVLHRETKTAAAVSNDEILWKIGNLNLRYRLYDHDTTVTMIDEYFRQHSTVVDTLPAGLAFVEAAYGAPPGEAGAASVTPISSYDETSGVTTLEFPMYTDPANPQELYIKTRYSGDYDQLTEAVNYTNQVSIRLRNTENGPIYEPPRMKNIRATTAIQPPMIANKSVQYNANTAPYAEYTVKINQSARDMIPAESGTQSFALHDSMGPALLFDDTTLRINGLPISDHPELTLTVGEAGTSFVIGGLQDETAYTITYKALVLLSAGDSLTAENAYNRIEIPGIEIPAQSVTETTITGQVHGSSGTAGGTTGRIRVHKVDDRSPAQPVEGAVFTVYSLGTVDSLSGSSQLPAEGTEVGTLTTGATGYSGFLQLSYGVVYGIRETTVPTGYRDPTNGQMVYFAYRSWDNTADLPPGVQDLTGTVAHTFAFVNKASAALTIVKTVDGSSAAGESFPFTLTSTQPMKPGEGYDLSEDGKTASFVLINGQSVTLTVYTGSEITLTETEHNGYTVLIKEGNQLLANGGTATFSIIHTVERTVTVHNTPGVVLPSTGGTGTRFLTLAGLLCMASALAYGYRLRRRHERRTE